MVVNKINNIIDKACQPLKPLFKGDTKAEEPKSEMIKEPKPENNANPGFKSLNTDVFEKSEDKKEI